jgi:hypothetical protein
MSVKIDDLTASMVVATDSSKILVSTLVSVDSSGNLGVNTATPKAQLDISSLDGRSAFAIDSDQRLSPFVMGSISNGGTGTITLKAGTAGSASPGHHVMEIDLVTLEAADGSASSIFWKGAFRLLSNAMPGTPITLTALQSFNIASVTCVLTAVGSSGRILCTITNNAGRDMNYNMVAIRLFAYGGNSEWYVLSHT